MAVILPKGTEIRCPRKHHLIAVTALDIVSGALVSLSTFNYEPGMALVQGEKPHCNTCGSAFIVQNKIHTSDGWKPSDPQLEPVAKR
jgi:hypothetical protein